MPRYIIQPFTSLKESAIAKEYPQSKFWRKVKKTSTCWVWMGAKTDRGYGEVSVIQLGVRKRFRAHRLSFIWAYGSIKAGLVVDHKCMRVCCVNPKHLRAVSQSVNATENTRGSFGEVNKNKEECIHGHKFTAENTFTDKQGWRHCKECSRRRDRERYPARREKSIAYSRAFYLSNKSKKTFNSKRVP